MTVGWGVGVTGFVKVFFRVPNKVAVIVFFLILTKNKIR